MESVPHMSEEVGFITPMCIHFPTGAPVTTLWPYPSCTASLPRVFTRGRLWHPVWGPHGCSPVGAYGFYFGYPSICQNRSYPYAHVCDKLSSSRCQHGSLPRVNTRGRIRHQHGSPHGCSPVAVHDLYFSSPYICVVIR